MTNFTEEKIRHTISIIVDNESGVLARVIGLFSGRGFNIEHLTVAPVDTVGEESRITVVTICTKHIAEQIKAQLDRLVPVHKVGDLSEGGDFVEREMALLKVKGRGSDREEALRIATAFRAKTVDSTKDSFIFEVTGKTEKVKAFILLMEDVGLVETVRTGVAGISRGRDGLL